MNGVSVADPTSFEMHKYPDGRVTVSFGGREYGPPMHIIETFTMNRNKILGDGIPVSFGVHVRTEKDRELVTAFVSLLPD